MDYSARHTLAQLRRMARALPRSADPRARLALARALRRTKRAAIREAFRTGSVRFVIFGSKS